jgi:DNA-binding GntR family transcriptional regulator
MLHVHQPEAAEARSLSEQAYYRLRELIVTIELAPGSVIAEPELMIRLGLGRTPIREALRNLQREKLIEVYPRRGMFVAAINVGDLAALSETRRTLEGSAAGLAAERATTEDREDIDALLAELGTVHGDQRRLIDLDQRVHRLVWACAHNPFLAATLEEYYIKTLRIWFLALDRVADLGDSVGEHRELLSSIRAGDAARASEAARRHVAGFETAVRAAL